jgi:hypothetical protein
VLRSQPRDGPAGPGTCPARRMRARPDASRARRVLPA